MSEKSVLITAASSAINAAVEHYFTNVSSGAEKQAELGFVAELLASQQPWLFFTEEAMEATHNLTTRSSSNVNVMYNLTVAFYSRLALNEKETVALIEHLADCIDAKRCTDDRVSFMAADYRNRLLTVDAHRSLMENNRNLVMLLCAILFLDTSILVSAVRAKA